MKETVVIEKKIGVLHSESAVEIDSMVEAIAGDTGTIYLQAKDVFGNNRRVGGDEVSAIFTSLINEGIQYRGSSIDNKDGTYVCTSKRSRVSSKFIIYDWLYQ